MTSKHSFNLPAWRIALKELRKGRPATYPLIDQYGVVEFYVVAPSKQQMVSLCYTYLKCPCAWIKVKYRTKGRPKRFFYVKLIDDYAVKWLRYLRKGNQQWRFIPRPKRKKHE